MVKHDRRLIDSSRAAYAAAPSRQDSIDSLKPPTRKNSDVGGLAAFTDLAALLVSPFAAWTHYAHGRLSKLGMSVRVPASRWTLPRFDTATKRMIDISLAGSALLLLSPLFIAVALLIKLDSKGPVFFVQRRYGCDKKIFRIFKFRSMTALEDDEHLKQATLNDARVTRVGAFLRRSNIDELPQLLNILRGEMSLVGPRPHALSHDEAFAQKIAFYARRHQVKPGMTGWAQVNGLRGEIKTDDDIRHRVEHDIYYIENWSLWLDVRILWLTIASPKTYRNAY